jgi:GDSL-like Lipase/Acylhydrolase family
MVLLVAVVASVLVGILNPLPARAAFSKEIIVVSLGDSYTAGNGAGNYYPNPNECHRSYDSYPWRYVNRLVAAGRPASIWQYACSGNVVADLQGQINQVETQKRLDASIVMLSIGGNDFKFSTIVRECLTVATLFPFFGCAGEISAAMDSLTYVRGQIKERLKDIATQFPKAQRIVLVGYPALTDPGCFYGLAPFNGTIRTLQESFDMEQGTLVQELNNNLGALPYAYNRRFEFVSLAAAYAGRGPCAGNPLVNDVQVLKSDWEWYHPTKEGHQLNADLIYGRGFHNQLSDPPPSDADGDGVPDSTDKCPNTPGPTSNFGCPIPPPQTDPLIRTIVQTGGIGVRLRNSAYINDIYQPVTVIPEGGTARVNCQTMGDAVGNYANRIWDQVTYAGITAYIPDAYMDTPNNANQYWTAVPQCSSPPPPPALAVVNGGFESGNAPWKKTFSPDGNFAQVNFASYTDVNRARSGSRFMEANTALVGGAIGQDIAFPIQPGVFYRLTAWVRDASGQSTPFIVKPTLWGLANGDEPSQTTVAVRDTWTPIEVILRPQRAHSTIRVEFYMESTGRNINFDDITLYATTADPQVQTANPIGDLNSVSTSPGQIRVSGWTFDPNEPSATNNVHIYFDQDGQDIGQANLLRSDVSNVFPYAGPNHGFDVTLPTNKVGPVNVCAYGINLREGTNDRIGACKSVNVAMRWPPREGDFLQTTDTGGRIYRIAGGAPLWITNWTPLGGPKPTLLVTQAQVDSLQRLPSNNALIRTAEDGRVYVMAGAAPLWLTDWSAHGGVQQPFVDVDAGALPQSITDGHLFTYPGNGTFLHTASLSALVTPYVMAGGAALPITSWTPWGGVQPFVRIPVGTIPALGYGHLRAVPQNSTILKGSPSGEYWEITDGKRRPANASNLAVLVNDSAINLFAIDPLFVGASTYAPLTNPARLLDTRSGGSTVDGLFAGQGRLSANVPFELSVHGRAGITTTASSVVLNTTVVSPVGDGYLTVYPCGVQPPNASNLNFKTGNTVANLVVAKVGVTGKICLLSSVATDVIVDVAGSTPSTSSFAALTSSARLLDTRSGGSTFDGLHQGVGQRPPNTVYELPVVGRGGVSASATGIVLNVTAVSPAGDGYISVFPCGSAVPNASNLNFVIGQTVPNLVVSKIGLGGKVCVVASAATELLVDASGFFTGTAGFVPLSNPARILDSRPGSSTIDGQHSAVGIRAAGSTYELPVRGRAGIGTSAQSVVLNITVAGGTGDGYITVYPCGSAKPNASNLNFRTGQTIANAVISKVSATGTVCLFTSASTHLLADVSATLT